MSGRLSWIIIGGGLHGVHLGAVLVGLARVPAERLQIVDPGERLMQVWDRCTRNTGMPFLRSPGVHHLDLNPWSLFEHAGVRPGRGQQPDFTRPYDRPSVPLFAAHSAAVVASYGLAERHRRGRVARLDLRDDGVLAELDDGTQLEAERAVLAVGMSGQPVWPDWAQALRAAGGPVRHVFDPDLELDPTRGPERAVVIGAGITGAQVALRLAEAGRKVTLLSRHPLREHQFDSDPGWIGPRYMDGFARERDVRRRRALILAARHRGSLPSDVHLALSGAIRRGAIQWRQGEVERAEPSPSSGATLRLRDGRVELGEVVLATGFEPRRPGGALVDDLVARHHLRCAPCGYPLVDASLRWHPRLHVSGPLAELELGPTARNIIGARRAGERILRR